MIKYISLDLQGTLSDSKFSDNYWLEIIPQKYSEKYGISIKEAKEVLKQKFKKYGVYNILYYDDKYWAKNLEFDTLKELQKSKIKPKLNQELFKFIEKLNIPKIIISTTTNLFINYELGNKINVFEKVYSCVDNFECGGKTKEIYENIAKELGVKTSEILHIGDNNIMDIENARKAGLNAILFCGNEKDIIEDIKKVIGGC